jgi:hypothetical protein
VKRFLFIVFHFPPISGSSGHLRAVKACKHLPRLGWTPTVLTVKSWTHERTEDSQLKEIPGEVRVLRCFALDTRRHLSIRGRHLLLMSLPDRWSTWLFCAVPSGWRAIHRDNAAVILSSFPIASAVLTGWILHRLTGRPWVVDVRDPLTKEGVSLKRSVRALMGWIESRVVRDACRLIFTTHAAREIYLRRYPNLSPARCTVVAHVPSASFISECSTRWIGIRVLFSKLSLG